MCFKDKSGKRKRRNILNVESYVGEKFIKMNVSKKGKGEIGVEE